MMKESSKNLCASTTSAGAISSSGNSHQSSQRQQQRPTSQIAFVGSSRSGPQTPPPPRSLMYDEVYEDAPINQGLLSKKRKRTRYGASPTKDWMRPYWLGSGLFLLLFAFWLLDSLKDPLFARLTQGNLDKHQPPAKLWSVFCTLVLVCLMEYLANLRQARSLETIKTQEEILDPGGHWNRMSVEERNKRHKQQQALDDTVSSSIFFQIGIPYSIAFLIIAYCIRCFQAIEGDRNEEIGEEEASSPSSFDVWYLLAYFLYATIESFGSISVATFWSYTNSTLALDDAERYYGPIIAIAQIGAIGGSTMVASDHWPAPVLLVAVSLIIILQVLLLWVYDRRFPPTSQLVVDVHQDNDEATILTWQDDNATLTKPFWSGLYLIFRHYYVLLILGVSCLYEISLTCLDYQMKLLGWARFQVQDDDGGDMTSSTGDDDNMMTFSQFMGHYGQVVNMTSLLFSSILFPLLIRKFGLRVTLRLFPTLLLLVTLVAYIALPGNLTVLFVSLSVLKAMTYSVHDPSKEILYIPTSNAVKFRAKFWIDVVGERISKAIGSAFNTFAGSVDRSVQIGGIPSLLSAAGLWMVCFYAGVEFDRLLVTGKIVGLDQSRDTYHRVHNRDGEDDGGDGSQPCEVEISFGEDSVSAFDPVMDPIVDFAPLSSPRSSMIELSPTKRDSNANTTTISA